MQPTPTAAFSLASFRSSFHQMIPAQTLRALTERFESGQGAPPTLPDPDLIETLVSHPLPSAGTLAEHLAELGQPPLRDASLAERRQQLAPRLFEQLLEVGWRPLAVPRSQSEAFDRGRRLLGIAGAPFSLRNTAPIRAQTTKARPRRGRAAFAKLGLCLISELGLHNPVVAAIGLASERSLARPCIPRLPARSLLRGDRLDGVGCCTRGVHPAVSGTRLRIPVLGARQPAGGAGAPGTGNAPQCGCGRVCGRRGVPRRRSWCAGTRGGGAGDRRVKPQMNTDETQMKGARR